MHPTGEAVSFHESALHMELRKLDEAALAFDAAQDELCTLLQAGNTPLWQLEDASREAVDRLKALKHQRDVVEWCREWVEQERKALASFRLDLDSIPAEGSGRR